MGSSPTFGITPSKSPLVTHFPNITDLGLVQLFRLFLNFRAPIVTLQRFALAGDSIDQLIPLPDPMHTPPNVSCPPGAVWTISTLKVNSAVVGHRWPLVEL